MASIQRRPRARGGDAWRVSFRAHGKVTSETFDDPEQAAYFAQLVDRIGGAAARAKRDAADGTDHPTLTEVLDHYIATAPDLTEGTAGEYRRILARSGIDAITGDCPINLITRDDIERWVRVRSMVERPNGDRLSAKTVKNEHGLISALLGHAVERGWCETNVARQVRLPRATPSEVVVLSEQEFLRLWQEMTPLYQPLVWLLAATGMRWGEATALQWRDVEGQHVTVRRAWKHGARSSERVAGLPKTSKSRRRIETTRMVIASLGERGEDDALVFTNARGGRVNYSTFHKSHWRPALQRAGLPKTTTIHQLRHFAASYMLSQGADIFEVSRALGHESVTTTTSTYGHLVPSRTRPTTVHAARMERLLLEG